MKIARQAVLGTLALLVAGCATTTVIDHKEPRRLVGTENDVRLDAEIAGDTLTIVQQIAIKYVVTNNRQEAIAFAELVPQSSYDDETHVVTVSLGTEVPGEEMLPRLVLVGPGQRKSFSTGARVVVPMKGTPANPYAVRPPGIQLKLNFLGDTRPFHTLIDIPERAVRDPRLAAELFPKWLEGNETLFTNVLPMRWSSGKSRDATDASQSRRQERP